MKERQQLENKVVIAVSDPEVKKEYGGAKIYYIYSIKGQDSKGVIDIQRRYSDFDLLKNLLIKRWPGCYIPSLPSKVKLSNSNEEFLETRSKYLRLFLLQLAKRSYIWNSDQVQLFLKNKAADYDKSIQGLWKIESSELAYRYINQFQHLETQEEDKLQTKISQFSKYLTILFVKIQELRNRSKELNDSQTRYQKKFSKFLLNTLMSYEEKFLTYYNEGNKDFNPIFSGAQTIQLKNDLEQSLKEVPLKILFEELKREKRQIFSIQQSLKQYEEYVKQKSRIQGRIKQHELKILQIQNGKQSLFSKIKNVFVDDQIKKHEKSIQKYKAELETYNKILKVMRIVVAQNQIQYFKRERTVSYYKMVQQIAREELNILEKQRHFWQSVCKNNHICFQIEQEQPKSNISSKKQIETQIKGPSGDHNKKESFQKVQKARSSKVMHYDESKIQILRDQVIEKIQQIEVKEQKIINKQKDQELKSKSSSKNKIQEKAQTRPQTKSQTRSQTMSQTRSQTISQSISQSKSQEQEKETKTQQATLQSQQKALKQLKNVNNELQIQPQSSKAQKQSKKGTQNEEYEQVEINE